MTRKSNRSNDVQSAGFESLAERLRQEANESRPEFSESLHRRIVRSVGERRAEGAVPAARNAAAERRFRRLAALTAAACFLAAAAIGWRLNGIALSPNGNGASSFDNRSAINKFIFNGKIEDVPPMDVLADHAVSNLDGLLASTGLAFPSTQLADDARQAADSLLQRLPLDMESESAGDR